MNLYRLGACLKCRGDLAYDDGDWNCLQCGVYYYTGLYPETESFAPVGGLLRIASRQIQGDKDANGQWQLTPAAD